MKMIGEYLWKQHKLILLLWLFVGIFAAVFSLYDLPMEAIGYAVSLCFTVGLVVVAFDLSGYARRHQKLQRLLQNVEEVAIQMPFPDGVLEMDYQALVCAVSTERNRIASEGENARQEMLDYYTLWAHQIKTPIAAMHLLLQKGTTPEQEALSAELFKVEEYVEMVLSYLRLGSNTTDYVLCQCDLDEIVRSCLRKYARLFILKKLTLQFEESYRTVITDEKWLSFLIGQIFSNAVKYTSEGGTVRVYSDGETLFIADSGIGIRAEDLPRVFEKGFTGYNGRGNQKSSGIGLYLCQQVTQRLGIELTITSHLEQGTIVGLILSESVSVVE